MRVRRSVVAGLLVVLGACSDDGDSGGSGGSGASAAAVEKGSCGIAASERTPVDIATPSGRDVVVSGTFDVAVEGDVATACLGDLLISLPGDLHVQFYNGRFGDEARGTIRLPASDVATYTAYSFRLPANDGGGYSVSISDGSNELATAFDQTDERQVAGEDNASLVDRLCRSITGADLAAAFPGLEGGEYQSNEFSCSFSSPRPDSTGLSIKIHNPNVDEDYIADQRRQASSHDQVEGVGDLAFTDAQTLKVFAKGFMFELTSFAAVPDLVGSETAIATILIANL